MEAIATTIASQSAFMPGAKFVAVDRRTFKRVKKITNALRPAFTNDSGTDLELIQDRSLADGVISLRTERNEEGD